jgi:hypothetical protein
MNVVFAAAETRAPAHRRAAAGALTVLCVFLLSDAYAGRHEKGGLTLSVGGSVSHTFTYDRKSTATYEWRGDELVLVPNKEAGEDYAATDLSLYLSAGYFVADRLELGLSGSAMTTRYTNATRGDFALQDARVHLKYFFDNNSSITPYVKLQGGASFLKSGDYDETDVIFGGLGGVEFFSMGPFTWFVELSSLYTVLGRDISGSEWRNQIYLGVTWYPNLLRKKEPAPAAAATGTAPPPPAPLADLSPDVRAWFEASEARWKDALDRLDRRTETARDAR